MKRPMKIVVFQEGSQYVAVCLNKFLVSQGSTCWQALEAFVDVFTAQLSFCDGLTGVEEAPKDYWQRHHGKNVWMNFTLGGSNFSDDVFSFSVYLDV